MTAPVVPLPARGPVVRSIVPPAEAPQHPLARIGAFVVLAVVAGVAVEALVYPAIGLVARLLGVRPLVGPWLTVGAMLAASWGASRWTDGGTPWLVRIGLGSSAWRVGPSLRALVIGAMPMAVTLGVLVSVGAYAVRPGAEGSWWSATAIALWTLAPSAFSEELLARGFVFSVLHEWKGTALATAVTSLGFAALHLLNPGVSAASVVNVALAGVLLAVVRLGTGSLIAAWAAHLAWNAVLVCAAHAPVSGLAFPTPGWRLVPQGAEWLSGGAWGPEASIVATVAIGAAIWAATRYARGTEPARLSTSDPRDDARVTTI
ncbi:MAG: type II CAAX endopeptidase family protein [Gemmatimonadaceae bacterium]|nr:type II CAAX endopeptidase family protein [Gemmatimonadaceae bacterium]